MASNSDRKRNHIMRKTNYSRRTNNMNASYRVLGKKKHTQTHTENKVRFEQTGTKTNPPKKKTKNKQTNKQTNEIRTQVGEYNVPLWDVVCLKSGGGWGGGVSSWKRGT